jgi:hypothetical protein
MRTFWSENLKGRGHPDDLGVHGTLGTMCVCVCVCVCEDVDWMHLA